MVESFGVAALSGSHPSPEHVALCLPGAVVGLAEQVKGIVEVGVRLVEAAEAEVSAGEVVVCTGQCLRIGKTLRGRYGDASDGGEFVPLAAQTEEVVEGLRQLAGVRIESVGGRMIHSGDKHPVFGGEPGQCLFVARRALRR